MQLHVIHVQCRSKIENRVNWQVFDSLDYDEKGLANGYDAFGCLLELGVYVPVVDIPAILKVRL